MLRKSLVIAFVLPFAFASSVFAQTVAPTPAAIPTASPIRAACVVPTSTFTNYMRAKVISELAAKGFSKPRVTIRITLERTPLVQVSDSSFAGLPTLVVGNASSGLAVALTASATPIGSRCLTKGSVMFDVMATNSTGTQRFLSTALNVPFEGAYR